MWGTAKRKTVTCDNALSVPYFFAVSAVCFVPFCVQESKEMKEVSIPPEVYKGTGHQLFDFLAATLRDFILEHKSKYVRGCCTAHTSRLE
jgi:hypothetical protein